MGKRTDKNELIDKEIRTALSNLRNVSLPDEFWTNYREEVFRRIDNGVIPSAVPLRRSAIWISCVRVAATFLIGLAIGYSLITFSFSKTTQPLPQPEVTGGESAELNTPQRYEALGVKVQPASDAIRSHLSLDRNIGLVISDFIDENLAQPAGIRLGDIIIEINGQPINNKSFSLPTDIVNLKIIRQGQEININIK